MRTIFVSREVWDSVWPQWPENRDGYRLSLFRGTLDSFTAGDWISVAENPYRKHPDAFLARVDPVEDEVWDIRSIAPKPGIRCFGSFAERDTFVGLTWDYRENLEGRDDWAAEIGRCKSEWQKLFGSEKPFKGETLDDYLSGNFDAV